MFVETTSIRISISKLNQIFNKEMNWAVIYFFITIGYLLVTPLHGDESPHGGTVVETSSGFHVEKLNTINKKICFYLLDQGQSTIKNDRLSGVVEFTMKDGRKETYKLKLLNDAETLRVAVEERKNIKTSNVTIYYNKKEITAQFN